jgi:hypothetical protein
MDIFGKISSRPSSSKRGNSSLCEREVRRDFSINVVIILRPLICNAAQNIFIDKNNRWVYSLREFDG